MSETEIKLWETMLHSSVLIAQSSSIKQTEAIEHIVKYVVVDMATEYVWSNTPPSRDITGLYYTVHCMT